MQKKAKIRSGEECCRIEQEKCHNRKKYFATLLHPRISYNYTPYLQKHSKKELPQVALEVNKKATLSTKE